MGRSWTSVCSKAPTGNKQSIYSVDIWEVGTHHIACGRVSEEGPEPQMPGRNCDNEAQGTALAGEKVLEHMAP